MLTAIKILIIHNTGNVLAPFNRLESHRMGNEAGSSIKNIYRIRKPGKLLIMGAWPRRE